MQTIFADFNAMTEAEHVCLTTRGSEEDIQRYQLHPGDWVWLSDGELRVAAKIATDPRYRLVGVPAWKTLVDFVDLETVDFTQVWSELQTLLRAPDRDENQSAKLFQLLCLFEAVAPESAKAIVPPGYLSRKRAAALAEMNQPELALLEIEEAIRSNPDDPSSRYLLLKLLAKLDLDQALTETEALTRGGDTHALVLVAAISVLGGHADRLADEGFPAVARRILELCDRFERAPGRESVPLSVLVEVLVNQGLTWLRLGQVGDAHHAFDHARRIDPGDTALGQATSLDKYDQRARNLAARFWGTLRAA